MLKSVQALPTSITGSQTGSWDNLTNILLDDGSVTTSQLTSQNTIVPYVKLSKFVGISIPADAVVKGVALTLTGKNQLSTGYGFMLAHTGLRLSNVAGTSASMTAFHGTQMTTKVVGGDSFLWNVAEILPEQINSDAFGVYLSFKNISTTAQKLILDSAKLEVFFEVAD